MNGNARNINDLGNALLQPSSLEPDSHHSLAVGTANLGLLGQGEHLGGNGGGKSEIYRLNEYAWFRSVDAVVVSLLV